MKSVIRAKAMIKLIIVGLELSTKRAPHITQYGVIIIKFIIEIIKKILLEFTFFLMMVELLAVSSFLALILCLININSIKDTTKLIKFGRPRETKKY